MRHTGLPQSAPAVRLLLRLLFTALLLAFAFSDRATAADWSRDSRIPPTGRPNPLELSSADLLTQARAGREHALAYPVEVTGMLAPWRSMFKLLGFSGPDALYSWLGLVSYPSVDDVSDPRSPYAIPFPSTGRPEFRMGVTLIQKESLGFTLSCATCHASSLFGRPVIGLTNRFPRANEFFRLGKKAAEALPTELFRLTTGADSGDVALYERLRANVRFVDDKAPEALGLDTSLAHVALSLAHRLPDEWATRDPQAALSPRPEPLRTEVADSKPAVWWNVKYKTRFLLDGSLVAGNPIYTNLLWNEIGRGTDLHELDDWISRNPSVIQELTAAVFSSEAPRFTDFFRVDATHLAAARRGEAVFNQRCAKCHGTYVKQWSAEGADRLPIEQQVATLEVRYHEKTPVIDVGTDPGRRWGMRSLAPALNQLAISNRLGIQLEPQKGYVPPPLVGIWARWPYFHNNSAPTLCAVLSPGPERPIVYHVGPADDPERDFDRDCNGYPLAPRNPPQWSLPSERAYDTRREGMSNRGHDEGILVSDGEPLITPNDRSDLIRFLQTL